MLTIFQGRHLALDGITDAIYVTLAVEMRQHIHEFHNGQNLNPLGVFLKIGLHTDAHGWSWPSRKSLMQATGIKTSGAISASLYHLRKMRIDGHRVLAMYRERDPNSQRWGRTAYRIFPDADYGEQHFFEHAPEHLTNLTEWHGKPKHRKKDKKNPMYDDPTLGQPSPADQDTAGKTNKDNQKEVMPDEEKPIQETDQETSNDLDEFFGPKQDNGDQPAMKVEPLTAEQRMAAAMGITASAEGEAIATGHETNQRPNAYQAPEWLPDWETATKRSHNQKYSLGHLLSWITRFEINEPELVIPSRDHSRIRGWVKGICDCLVPFEELGQQAKVPLDKHTIVRLGVLGLDLFYAQRRQGKHDFDIASPHSLKNVMRRIAGEIRTMQQEQGLRVSEIPVIDDGVVDSELADIVREGERLSASIG